VLYFFIISIPFIFLITRIYKNYNLKLKAFNEELIHHKENLEFLVQERTKQLQESNDKLEEELKIRTETEKILHLKRKNWKMPWQKSKLSVDYCQYVHHAKKLEMTEATGNK
jgi:C4-dicarboxylate-specific signal transduction histidine kinase